MDFYFEKAKNNKRGPSSQSDPQSDPDAANEFLRVLRDFGIGIG